MKTENTVKSALLGLLTLVLLMSTQTVCAEDAATTTIAVKSGEKIAFLGDSITAAGAKSGGYCRLVLEGLKKAGVDASGVFAGISGHKSNQMLARLEKDVLSKKPKWMTLSCGVNDVWHGKRGVKLEDYKTNITAIVDKAQAAGVNVIILTSTMIKEDQKNDLNQTLKGYNDFLKELAVSKKCILADLNADMQKALTTFPDFLPKGKLLTRDGVHMNAAGNFMMAKGILTAIGVPAETLATFENEWKDKPDGQYVGIRTGFAMTVRQYETILEREKKSPEQIIQECVEQKKQELLKSVQ